jgi:hypothetical protein
MITNVQLTWSVRSELQTKRDSLWKTRRSESKKIKSVARAKEIEKDFSSLRTKRRSIMPVLTSDFLQIPSRLKRNAKNLDY